MPETSYPYYSIVTFGATSYGTRRHYYRSLSRAVADARTLGGGTCTTVRVVGCQSRKQAIDADISGPLPVVWS